MWFFGKPRDLMAFLKSLVDTYGGKQKMIAVAIMWQKEHDNEEELF